MHGFSCSTQANMLGHADGKTRKATISGDVTKSFTSGMPGGHGGPMELQACSVTAVESKTHKTVRAAVGKNGRYTLDVPPGSYQVVFDDCFKCVVKFHKKLQTLELKAGDLANARGECELMGK